MLETLAQSIADITAETIGRQVLITDERGIVLGASDRSRVGTFHEASLHVVRAGKPESHDSKAVVGLRGVKPGITLPIGLFGETVGTVAISGEPEDVSEFGLLVQKHTELILREEMALRSALLRDRALQNLLQELSVFDPEKDDEFLLLTRGFELGYDLRVPRLAVVIDLYEGPGPSPGGKGQLLHRNGEAGLHSESVEFDILAIIRKYFSHPEDIATMMGPEKYAVLHPAGERNNGQSTRAIVEEKCRCLREALKKRGFDAGIGVGPLASTVAHLGQSYRDAWQALALGRRLAKEPGVFWAEDFYTERLIAGANRAFSRRFLAQTLGRLRGLKDWPEMAETVRAWCESSFSPIKAAEALQIHRNTLFYRLEKIQKVTGKNLRDFKDALTLYCAIKLDALTDEEATPPWDALQRDRALPAAGKNTGPPPRAE